MRWQGPSSDGCGAGCEREGVRHRQVLGTMEVQEAGALVVFVKTLYGRLRGRWPPLTQISLLVQQNLGAHT